MLSLESKNQVVLEQKIDWNLRSLQGVEAGSNVNTKAPQYIKIVRNLKDDTFNIVAPRRITNSDVFFAVNNQQLSGVISAEKVGDYTRLTAHRSLFKDTPLSKITEISARQSIITGDGSLAYSMTLFPYIHPMNKNISLKPGQYLKLISPKTVTFATKPGTEEKQDKVVKDGTIQPIYTQNITYVVPKPLNEIKGNHEIFDIYTMNTKDNSEYADKNDESIFADYSMGEGKITSTSLSKTGLKTYFNPADNNETLLVDGKGTPAAKVGEVELFDNQFYNYDSKKVETGYGKYSEQGMLVPYNFTGEFKEKIDFTPNYAFKDLSINMTHDIEQPLLNKYDGKIILNIEETDETAGPFKVIPSDKIKMLADNDPTISGLERISIEEAL